MNDGNPKQSLADDPTFLASLEGLDNGLGAGKEERAGPLSSASPPSPTVSPPATDASTNPPPRRSVLDLFPPPRPPERPSEPAVAPPPPAPTRVGTTPRPVASAPPLVAPAPSAKPYLALYDLDEEPFALAPDPRFFFHSASHDKAAQELLTAIRRRDGIVVVTGAPGVGKTTLCRTVVEQLDRRTLTCYLVDPPATFEDLLVAVLADFGVISREDIERRPPAPELLGPLREFLVSLAPLQAFGVIFVDDADRVPSSVLRQAAALLETGGEERLLQLVLVGTERLERTLARRDLKALSAAVAVRCRLSPLEASEVGPYVSYRLMVAGPNRRVDFTGDAFARLHELSGGSPALVNALCDRALQIGAEAAEAAIDRPIVDEAAAALGIGLPESPLRRTARFATALLLLALLMAAGAIAAGYVFQDRLASVIRRWEQVVPPPRPPPPLPTEPQRH